MEHALACRAKGANRVSARRLPLCECDHDYRFEYKSSAPAPAIVRTLARDSSRLVDAGYRIEEASAFDLFPNTPHVEIVVSFVASGFSRTSA